MASGYIFGYFPTAAEAHAAAYLEAKLGSSSFFSLFGRIAAGVIALPVQRYLFCSDSGAVSQFNEAG